MSYISDMRRYIGARGLCGATLNFSRRMRSQGLRAAQNLL